MVDLPASFSSLPMYSWLSYAAYEKCAFDYLLERAYGRSGAAAILANLEQESGLNPNARRIDDAGEGQDSVGIAQWNRTRLANMKNFVCNVIGNIPYESFSVQQKFYGQLQFVDHEVTRNYPTARQVLISQSGSPTLASMFGHIYEGFSARSGPARDDKMAAILAKYPES